MAKPYKNGILIADVFIPTGAQPLDARSVVENLSDLYNAETFGSAVYNGMTVSVLSEDAIYLLKDKSKITSEAGWEKLGKGEGIGAIAVDNYNIALSLATSGNKGQIIYVNNAIGTVGSTDYKSAGPYIVTGLSSLQFLTTDTGSGETPVERIAALETKVGNDTVANQISSAITNIEESSKTAEDNGISITVKSKSGKVTDVSIDASYIGSTYLKKEDTSLYTKAEKDKVTSVETGAQKNKIETVKVNGKELNIDLNKAVNIEIPEIPDPIEYKGENAVNVSAVADNSAKVTLKIADGNNILYQNGDGLNATLSISYSDQKIQLKGIEGKLISEFDASMFVKDGMIETAELVTDPENLDPGTYIKIVFNSAGPSDPIYVNVTTLIDIYTAGSGIDMSGKVISVKKDTSDDEGYLKISEAGIKVTGINKLVDDAVENINGSITDISTKLNTLIGELATNNYTKKVEIAKDSSNALEATTDNFGKVTLGVTDVLQNIIAGFSNKLDPTDISTGSKNGTIKVRNTEVEVKGLKSAAYTDSSMYLEYNALDWTLVE